MTKRNHDLAGSHISQIIVGRVERAEEGAPRGDKQIPGGKHNAEGADGGVHRIYTEGSRQDGELAGKAKTGRAELVGSLVARRALDAGIKQVVFDRGGYRYHGRVKAVAEAARHLGSLSAGRGTRQQRSAWPGPGASGGP